ncbi:TonB-dependent receptor [Tsuneonella sp. CC-YZS046]|uniref:TonB-dependent receptor n=1 Tax=Tsuneonella sp. CC-YZS046 TaxID=3042152 RepID=UPI002D7897B7|nr:TonB-dependent receptor [Tsuneonella sp. CC-YZS046]WRO66211.1 TonB-dependent receptor [Tsuneonella sp. CC-YZS046]
MDAAVAVDIPLIKDRLLSTFAVSRTKRDGWQRRAAFPGVTSSETEANFVPGGIVQGLGAKDRLGGGHEFNARGKLLWKGDDIRLTLTGDYSRARQGASPYHLIRTAQLDPSGNPTLAGLYNICIGTPAAALDTIGLGAVCGPRVGPGTALAGVNVDADPTNDVAPYDDRYVSDRLNVTYGAGNNYSRLRNYGFAGTVDIDISDGIALKSITAYRNQKWAIGLDIDGSPAIIFQPTITQSQHQFSQEFQLSGSSIDDRLKWVVGAYYFDESADEEQNPIFAGGIFSVYNPIRFKTKSYAAFAHMNFAITDQLGITLGGRYTKEKKRFWPSQIDANLFLQKLLGLPSVLYPDPADLSQLQPTALQKQKFDDFSPRLGLEFKPNDDIMIYGSYSRGYKSGGWTTRVTAPVLSAPTFKEETAETFELGVKSILWNRRLQINAAAFTTKYKDMQLLIQRGVSPTFENAGDARIKGFELEVQARLVDGLRLNGSLGYIDAHYTSVDDPTGVILKDSDLPKVAKWTAHAGPEYRLAFANDSSLTLRADYFYRSRMASDSENTPELYGKSHSTVDLSATYALPDNKLSFTAGGRNVFNERFIVNGTNQLAGAGTLFATYNRPAEWYVSARFDF